MFFFFFFLNTCQSQSITSFAVNYYSCSANLLGQGQSPPLMSKLGPPPPRPLKPKQKHPIIAFRFNKKKKQQTNIKPVSADLYRPRPVFPPLCANSDLCVANSTLMVLPLNSLPGMQTDAFF